MDTLEVALGARSYPIHIGAGLIGDRELLENTIAAEQVLIVADTTVAPLYLDTLQRSLAERTCRTHVLADGEQHKTLATLAEIVDTLVAENFHRDACVVALGGGVVGDIAGFTAACYQRGIDFVQVPTTLLAQVDSSVGGKTAVNHPRAKNMIGAFYQPTAVIADIETLATLPPRQLAAGLAEVVKYGLILDAEFFAWLEKHVEALLALDVDGLSHIVRRSCELKAAIVAEDEHERGRRALLNLGHTFGHALESLGGYGRWLHGEAVAIGTVLAARTSVEVGKLAAGDAERIEALLVRFGLPTRASGLSERAILEAMAIDKKATATGLKLVLLDEIGTGVIEAAPPSDVLLRVLADASAD
jgi:3-dehydroquinate synthase